MAVIYCCAATQDSINAKVGKTLYAPVGTVCSCTGWGWSGNGLVEVDYLVSTAVDK